ncbi:MAG TPA: glucosyl-3-phosphoglycerate synthase [Thermoleophilaceae bacterium]|nr:glucosyl-3-phosphoglycerate synthase [Thermoleophilaceae bacterium]
MIRSFHHSRFPLELLLERKRETVTVVLPTREVADTVGPIVEHVVGLPELVDQVLVVDAASSDGTAELAAGLGAEVHQEAELVPDVGPVLGKGDAMWRALSVARGELIAYLDSDTRSFPDHFVTGMLGPLLLEPDARFVKGAYRRPFATAGGEERPADGGRVTELCARPLLSVFYPDLAAFAQPLAGEVAARRELLHRVPFATGYAVETSMLLHVYDLLGGTEGMVQVDLDVRRNHHQPLHQLGPMAYSVLRAVTDRLRSEGRLLDRGSPRFRNAEGRLVAVDVVERPPFATLLAAAS